MNGTTTKHLIGSTLLAVGAALVPLLGAGCGSTPEKRQPDFHTSGSRDADQRAEQEVAKVQQLRGEGVGDDKKGGSGKRDINHTEPVSKDEVKRDVKQPLYDRLGGEKGITLIVEDWVNRAIADPRVNWTRKGITQGGFSIHRNKSVEWQNTPENGTALKGHIKQFLMLSTGGPPKYEGKEMKPAHASLNIANDEFDAAIGDLKSSLDNLQVPTGEQKELLAIVESTRPQVVTKR
jgi:hemoglobin